MTTITAGTSSREPAPSGPDLGLHDSIEELKVARDRDEVTFPMAMKALYLQHPAWNADAASRRRYCELYPELCRAFVERAGGVRESLYVDEFPAGVALTEDCELYTSIWWEHLNFNTAKARVLEAKLSDLRSRVQQYLSDELRKIHMQHVLRLYMGLISTLRREWHRHPKPDPKATEKVTEPVKADHLEDLDQLDDERIVAEAAYQAAGRERGESRYMAGVAFGALGIVLAAGFFAWRLGEADHTIWLGTLAAGAVGGLLSVLERYSRNKLRLQFESNRLGLKGVSRPVVGALSGLALYLLINAGFLPFDPGDRELTQGLGFIGLALVAGFSERLLKDVMEKASGTAANDEREIKQETMVGAKARLKPKDAAARNGKPTTGTPQPVR